MQHFVSNIDPELIKLGPLTIHWYGVLFASAILAGLQYMKFVFKRESQPEDALDNLLIYVVVGIVVGARLGHCLFYDPQFYLANPLKILAIWEGGLASHGGGLGAIIGAYLYCKKSSFSFLWMLDRLAIATALFGIFVRTANFVNAEIIGKPADVPWAIVFAKVDNIARHPAQLYEAFAYLLIFIVLHFLYKKDTLNQRQGLLFGTFLILVFSARIIIEFFKQPQAAYSTELALNTGQLLSIPFMLVGVALIALSNKTTSKG